MDIKLPTQVAHLVGKVKEEELLFIAFLHHIRKKYPDYEWFNIYIYDMNTILGKVHASPSPFFAVQNIKHIMKVRYSSDYKLDVKLKNWTGEEFTYNLQSFRNVVVWSMILDHNNLVETPKNTYGNKTYWSNAAPNKRYITSAIKSQYHKYDSA